MRRSPCSQQCQTSLRYVRMRLVFLVLVCWMFFWCWFVGGYFGARCLLTSVYSIYVIFFNYWPYTLTKIQITTFFILVSLFRFAYEEPLPIFGGANFSMYLDGIIVAPPKTIIQGSRKSNVGYYCEPRLHVIGQCTLATLFPSMVIRWLPSICPPPHGHNGLPWTPCSHHRTSTTSLSSSCEPRAAWIGENLESWHMASTYKRDRSYVN
jgi:hypothetical protein